MFEIKENGFEGLMIGNWVDILEFANRWNKIPQIEKELICELDDYKGTYSDIAKELLDDKYSLFEVKMAIIHLEKIGFIVLSDDTLTYHVLSMPELINALLEL